MRGLPQQINYIIYVFHCLKKENKTKLVVNRQTLQLQLPATPVQGLLFLVL